MKILSVCAGFGQASLKRILKIRTILESNGHEVHLVLYSHPSKLEISYVRRNFCLVNASQPSVHIKHLKTLLADHYDLVFGNDILGTFCALLGKLTRVPLICDMHGSWPEDVMASGSSSSSQYWINKLIESSALKFSNKINCVSRHMMDYVHDRHNISMDRLSYVTNGVDLQHYDLSLTSRRREELVTQLELGDGLIFGYIGNYQKYQGVENLIRAAQSITDKSAEFILVGGKKRIKKGNLTYIPQISTDLVPVYYSLCDVLILPRPSCVATNIAAPTKFAEYTASSTPVLVTNVGDAAQLVKDYDCGVVIEDNSPQNLVNGVYNFLEKSDQELRMMGRNARTLAQKEFDWDKVEINLLNAVES